MRSACSGNGSGSASSSIATSRIVSNPPAAKTCGIAARSIRCPHKRYSRANAASVPRSSRSNTVGIRSRHFPETDRRLAEAIVAGLLAGCRPFHTLRHAFGQRPVLDHLDERRGGVSEIEEVALPRPLVAPGVPEPATADAGDFVSAPVCALRVGDLLPQPDHLALHVVDQNLLIRIRPSIQAAHLAAERDGADLV